jgi:hypothetical protein
LVVNTLPPNAPDEEAFEAAFKHMRILEAARSDNLYLVGSDKPLRKEVPDRHFDRLGGYDKAQAQLVQIS